MFRFYLFFVRFVFAFFIFILYSSCVSLRTKTRQRQTFNVSDERNNKNLTMWCDDSCEKFLNLMMIIMMMRLTDRKNPETIECELKEWSDERREKTL